MITLQKSEKTLQHMVTSQHFIDINLLFFLFLQVNENNRILRTKLKNNLICFDNYIKLKHVIFQLHFYSAIV